MSYKDTMKEINSVRAEIMSLRKSIRGLQATIEPEEVSDYEFRTGSGDVSLSSLFGGKDCVHCTQWADGFNGLLDHLRNRAAFVVSSPDHPEIQKAFAESRGWTFTMVSHNGTSFAGDMGYIGEYEGKESFWPGVSVFRKTGDKILRVSDTPFGPGDDFNPVLSFFGLIPEGVAGWEPKFDYA